MTKAEIRLSVLRTQVVALEEYGFHVFLWRWWHRDGFGFRHKRVVHL
jgi:hypothetical protein